MIGIAVLLAVSACTSSPRPDPSKSSSAAQFVIGAPADCLVNAYCGKGLASVYGIDVKSHLRGANRVAQSVAALKAGSVQLAVVFSRSPYAREKDLIRLRDDRGMLASDHVTPIFRRSLTDVYGADLGSTLDALAAHLSNSALSSIDSAIASGKSPQDAAQAWVDSAVTGTADAVRPGPTLTIGSAGFAESIALANVIADYLRHHGFPTRVVDQPGGRAQLVDGLANGEIDVAPEYTSSLLEYLNGYKGEATSDSSKTSKRLGEYLDLIGVSYAGPAAATSTNAFVTTKAIADRYHLTSLSDLTRVGLPSTPKSKPRGISGPAELGILVRAVGHQLAVGSKGPEVRDVQERLKSLGYDVTANGVFDVVTVAAVRKFQGSQGIAPTGVVNQTTEQALASPKGTGANQNPVNPGDDGAANPPNTTPSGGKIFYLTFDDGPAVTYTLQILALLDQYGAKATFFELGDNATAHPELTRAVLSHGQELANHTWDHADMTTLSANALDNEITSATQALQKISGRTITCLRPPYGAVDSQVRKAVAAKGLALHLWDIDPQDWNRPGVAAIVDNVVSHAHPGAVSLMHDGGGDRSESVAALAQILPKLKALGYTFASLPGC